MRSINVTTDVYAAIWAAREQGEETEDAILRRVLSVRSSPDSPSSPTEVGEKIGFRDPRFDVTLPEGFEIFRTYKGQEYRARAIGGQLELLNSGKRFPSLNKASRAVSGNIENAWRNWYFMGSDGKRHLVEGLRSDIKPNVRHLV